ncbi:MAG: RluA family pseudouridine synthase [Myxococcales bacterium]|nr:RluA family pseudouridine synthase [Myxococcales bacterium]
MSERELLVDASGAGQRADLFVGHALGLSRARLKELFESGKVRIDGRRARKGDRVAAGQRVSVPIEEAPLAPVPEPAAELRVLWSDDWLVFVDKPAGAPSHPLRPGELGTVANALSARYPECALASEDPREGGLCHRLDSETSGVLLAARRREAWQAVRAAFSARKVDKRYWALCTGPIAGEGEIDLPLRHARSDRVEPAPAGGAGTREALSSFKVLSRKGEHALVEVRIVTGVMHQVRAHLSAIGAPIVGDELYGGRPAPELGRVFLHARALELAHPVTGQTVRVESPLPQQLRSELERLGLAAATPPSP